MTRKCLYCGERLVAPEFDTGLAIKTGRDRYAHVGCIDSHRAGKCVDESAQQILGAADSAHQSLALAISLLQEALGNMGEILTAGCTQLGPASLNSTMELGQCIKDMRFLLDNGVKAAHGLCILLGKDLGVCEDDAQTLGDMVGEPLGTPDFRDLLDTLDSIDLEPREDEHDDDEIPF